MKYFILNNTAEVSDATICRTAVCAYQTLEVETFDVYYFESDLGETMPGTSGYEVLKWAVMANKIPIGAKVILTTNNFVSRYNMASLLTSNGFSIVHLNQFKRIK